MNQYHAMRTRPVPASHRRTGRRKQSKKEVILSYLSLGFLPFVLFVFEFVLKLALFGSISGKEFLYALLFSLAFGLGVTAFCRLFALVLVLQIIYRRDNPSYKIGWIIPVMAMPLFGGLLYLVFGKTRLSRRELEKMRSIARDFGSAMAGVEDVLPAMEQQDPAGAWAASAA